MYFPKSAGERGRVVVLAALDRTTDAVIDCMRIVRLLALVTRRRSGHARGRPRAKAIAAAESSTDGDRVRIGSVYNE
jgi:hypothetical protein